MDHPTRYNCYHYFKLHCHEATRKRSFVMNLSPRCIYTATGDASQYPFFRGKL